MRTIALILLLIIPWSVHGQSSAKVYRFQFTDKDNTPFSLDRPLEFLSQRALDRRQRQHISLDERDLPVDPAYIQAVLDEGAFYLTRSKWFNTVTVAVLNDAIRDSILDLPFIVDGSPVGKRGQGQTRIDKSAPLADAKDLSVQLYSESDYGMAFNQIDMLGGTALHAQGFRGEGMLIAVLDAGFPNVDQHPVFDSLRNDGRLIGGWDLIDNDNTVFAHSSHGFSVLSTMAGYLPGSFIGTAPKASYLLLRTENADSESPVELDYWVAGAEFADSAGADVINSSLGYTTFDNSEFDFSYADLDGNTIRGTQGADMAASRGILVVNSAGNSGNGPWQYIGVPADGDSVLAVGAVDASGVRASFSSIGPSADGDIKPNVCAQGYLAAIVNGAGAIATGNGTSFSGPILAGLAACLWQAHLDSATNMDIFHAIEQSADHYQNPDEFCGYGIPDFTKANLLLSNLNPADENRSELFPVYPNPFTDEVRAIFYSPSQQHIVVRLVNTLGQEIGRVERTVTPFSGTTIDFRGLQDLSEGIYMLYIDAGSGEYYQKLMKSKTQM